MTTRTMIAITNRHAANEIGGKLRRPILIASHVELHTMQSVTNAITIATLLVCGIA